jgi:hypothetical protein
MQLRVKSEQWLLLSSPIATAAAMASAVIESPGGAGGLRHWKSGAIWVPVLHDSENIGDVLYGDLENRRRPGAGRLLASQGPAKLDDFPLTCPQALGPEECTPPPVR